MIRERAGLVWLAWVAALASGCTEGLKQEHPAALIRVEPDGRRLTALVVYQGLHVAGGSSPAERARTLDQAKSELGVFRDDGRKFGIFLFGHAVTVDLGPVAEDDPKTASRRKSLGDSIRVDTRGFFLDPKEGLCLRQEIRMDDLPGLVRSCNAWISESLGAEMTRQLDAQDPPAPNESLKLSRSVKRSLQAAAKAGHDWLRITPGRIAVNFPITADDAADLLRQVEASPDANDRAVLATLRAAIEGFEVKAGADGLTLSMGDGWRRTIAIRMPAPASDQPRRDAELIEYARTLALPFDPKLDVETLIREFAAK